MSVVEWQESARDELADVWVEATPDEREQIFAIIERLERDLRKDPFAVGQSRSGGVRVEIRPPLVVYFEVSPDGGRVRIVRVRRPRPRSKS